MDERSRRALARKLDDVLGPDEAMTLMESLPPSPWSEMATKKDIGELKRELKEDIRASEERFGFRLETLEHRLLASMRGEMNQLMLTMVGSFETQTRTIVITLVGTLIAFAAVLVGALKL